MSKISYTAASQRLLKSAVAALMAAAMVIIPGAAQASSGNEAIDTVDNFDGVAPSRIAFTPDGTKAYVANTGSSTVSVIDTQKGAEETLISLPVGSTPTNVAVSPDGAKVYVLDPILHSIYVIDTKTDEMAKQSTVLGYTGTSPYGIAFNPAEGTHLAYVTNNDIAASVSIIDTSKDTQTGMVAGYAKDQGAHGVAFAPNGNTAYVATAKSVVAIDVTAGAQTQSIADYTGTMPLNIAFTPNGKKAYVLNQGSGTVSVIDTQANKQTGVVGKFTGVHPAVIAVTPDGATAYVTGYDSATVSVINVENDTQTGTVNLGKYEARQPDGVAFRPDTDPDKAGDLAYVVNNGSNSVTIIQVPAAPAIIQAISPPAGLTIGGTNVNITGFNLTDSTTVTFGGVEGKNLTVTSSTNLSVVTPAATGNEPGPVDVVVKNPGGDGKDADGFTYITVFD